MLPSEATAAITRLLRVFPRWDKTVTDEELGIWRGELEKLEVSSERLDAAITELYKKSRYLAPRWVELIECLRILPGHGLPAESLPSVCVAGEVYCVRLGTQHVQALVWHEERVPLPAQQAEIARGQILGDDKRPGLAAVYGGEWDLVRGCGHPFDARAAVDPGFARKRAAVAAYYEGGGRPREDLVAYLEAGGEQAGEGDGDEVKHTPDRKPVANPARALRETAAALRGLYGPRE